MAEYSDCEIVYPDPRVFKNLIGYWSRKNIRVWDDLAKTLEYEYEPLWNYDRTEEHWYTGNASETVGENFGESTKARGTGSNTGNLDSTHTDNLTTTNNTTETTDRKTETDMEHNTRGTDENVTSGDVNKTGNSTSTNYSTAFNNGAEVMHDKTVTDSTEHTTSSGNDTLTRDMRVDDVGSVTDTGTVKNTGDVKNTGTTSEAQNTSGATEYEDSSDNTSKRDLERANSDDHHEFIRAFGNIGITSAQDMLSQQRAVVQFNLYDLIIKQFAQEFLLLVY